MLVTDAIKRGSESLSDEEIKKMEYGITYYDPSPSEVEAAGLTWEQYIEGMKALRTRLKTIENADKRHGENQPDYPDGRELDCGCIVYYKSEVMNASMGTACADCYDEMSDEED